MTLLYNLVILTLDILAIWLIRRRTSLLAWFGVMAGLGCFSILLAGAITARFEDHFGFFRLASYAIFLHAVGLSFVTVLLWRRSRPRLALILALGALGVILIGIDAFIIEPHWLDVSYRRFASSKIGRPVRIAFVADLQAKTVGPYERMVLQRTLDEKPDLILLGGDYLQTPDQSRKEQIQKLRELLTELHFTAPLGVYAIRGNMEPAGLDKVFADLGITTVERCRSFDTLGFRLTCLGLHESANTRLQLPESPDDQFHLVLGHVPNFALSIKADLLLAGHTHGGQVRLPGIGPIITHARVPHQWAAGLTELPQGGQLLVSRGLGMERDHAPPMRFLCRPELVIIDLVPEKANVAKSQ